MVVDGVPTMEVKSKEKGILKTEARPRSAERAELIPEVVELGWYNSCLDTWGPLTEIPVSDLDQQYSVGTSVKGRSTAIVQTLDTNCIYYYKKVVEFFGEQQVCSEVLDMKTYSYSFIFSTKNYNNGSFDRPPLSPQPSVDRLSVTWAEPTSMTSGVNLFHLPSDTPINNEIKFSPSAGDGSEDEDYSASLSAVLRQRRASVRRSRKGRVRRPSSPFQTEDRSRRRSSVFTTSSGDTAISIDESHPIIVTQEQIFETIHLHKEVLGSVKQQPLGMRRKLKIVHQAKRYIKRHEGQLQERLAQSKSTRDIYARFNILIATKWQQMKREAANLSNVLIPWELRIKEIESHFGSVVASYFTFLRWLFWVNLVIGFILLVFVIVPEYLTANPEQDGERKIIMEEERRNATNLLTLWEFEGVLKYSPIFYGYYSNIEKSEYRMPLAYFLTGLVVYIYSFVAILRKMAENSRMSKLSEKEDECIFSWKLFTGWDFMIGNAETAHNRIASVILGFKEALLEEAEKKKDLRNWRIIFLRALVNLCVVVLLAVSAYAVVTVVSRSDSNTKASGWWRENETTIVVTVISITFPVFFELLGYLEHYHPRNQLRLQLAKIMLLNLLNLYSLIFALFTKIEGMTGELDSLKPNITLNASVGSNASLNMSESLIKLTCIEVNVPCLPCEAFFTASTTSNERFLAESTIFYPTQSYDNKNAEINVPQNYIKPNNLKDLFQPTAVNDLIPVINDDTNSSIKIVNKELERIRNLSFLYTEPTDLSDTNLDLNENYDDETFYTFSNDSESSTSKIMSSSLDSINSNSDSSLTDDWLSREQSVSIKSTSKDISVHTETTQNYLSNETVTVLMEFDINDMNMSSSELPYTINYTNTNNRTSWDVTIEVLMQNLTTSNLESNYFTTTINTTEDSFPTSFQTEDLLSTETLETHDTSSNYNNDSQTLTTFSFYTSAIGYTTETDSLPLSKTSSSSVQITDPTFSFVNDSSNKLENNKNLSIDSTTDSYSSTASYLYSSEIPSTSEIMKITNCPDITYNCSIACGKQNLTQVLKMSNCRVVEKKCYFMKCTSYEYNNTTESTKNITPITDFIYYNKNVQMYNLSQATRTKLLKLCWETMFGQELVKLTMMDLVFVLLGTLFMDFFRSLFVRYMNRCWCWDLEKKFPEYGDFKIAENILHLINNQGMVWMGMFFSPGLVVLNVFKLVIMMYLRSWAVMTCNVPHEVIFRVSKSNNFYLALLLTMLFLCVLPVGYSIVWVKPSWHCGPFSGYEKIYHILTINITKLLPTSLNFAIRYIASPAIVIPLLVLLILIIYYLTSLTNSLREANNDLKIQLRRERTEERRKVFQIADNRRRTGTSAIENTPFARWKKALPTLPLSKSIDSDDRKTTTADDSTEARQITKKKAGIFAKIVSMALDTKSDLHQNSHVTSMSENIDDETDTDFHEVLSPEILQKNDIIVAKHPEKERRKIEFVTEDVCEKHRLRLDCQKLKEKLPMERMPQLLSGSIISFKNCSESIKKYPNENIITNNKNLLDADLKNIKGDINTENRSVVVSQIDSSGAVIPVITISTTESDEEANQSKKDISKLKEGRGYGKIIESENTESKKVKKLKTDLKTLRRQSSVESANEFRVPKRPEDVHGHRYQYSL